jgi:succinate dehydrogenase / fumarate reductase cytochrome b subunit
MRVSDATYDTLKRLHSLTGVVPIGAFLLEHFFTNSHALESPAAFDRAAAFLSGLPYVTLIEAFGIWLPILFHMVLGIVIATSGQATLRGPRHSRHIHYVLQRATGLFLVVFIVFHTWSTRFNDAALSAPSLYEYIRHHLSNPAVFAFYVVGVVSACYHLGNGLFGFAIHWGLVTGERAQRRMGRLGLAFALVLSLVGINSMLAFVGRGINPFPKTHVTEATVALPPAAGTR